jgi:rare lipoprotein A
MKKVNGIYAAVVLAAAWLVGCEQALAECGIASTYSSGTRTANGELYNHMAISAAHKTLPFGSRVVVRNQRTGRSITVRINDRGPFVAGRIIDLSTGAKNALGMDGLASVCLEVVSFGSGKRGYEKPNLGERLLQALNPFGHRGGRAGGQVRVAKAVQGETRTAGVQGRQKHYASRSAGRKRYAGARHRRSVHRRLHRRLYASRQD